MFFFNFFPLLIGVEGAKTPAGVRGWGDPAGAKAPRKLPGTPAESEAPGTEINRQISKNVARKKDAPKSYTFGTSSFLFLKGGIEMFCPSITNEVITTYQIETDLWAVLVNVENKIAPLEVEQLAKEHHREQITSGKSGIHAVGFANFINKKIGIEIAQPASYKSVGKHLIFV
jgi:hypothetical protein